MAEHDHQCAWGCGNTADNVVINLNTSEADILCTPCFLRLANDISQAWLESMQEKDKENSSDDSQDRFSIEPDSDPASGPPRGADTADDGSGSDLGSADYPAGDESDDASLGPDDPPEYSIPDTEYSDVSYDVPQCPDCGGTDAHQGGCAFA